MKIIVVNISKTINDIGPKKVTERAWKLNKEKAENYDYVIGISKGKIYPFDLLKVRNDEEHKNRVVFDLKECSDKNQADIEKYVDLNKSKTLETWR